MFSVARRVACKGLNNAAASRWLSTSAAAASTGPSEGDMLSGGCVGVVGLGKMGSGMVANLLDAGNTAVVYDASDAARQAWASTEGVTLATNARDVAAQADAVVSVLPNDAVLTSVIMDADAGLLAGWNEGGLHISVSTVSPHTSRAMAAVHAAQGCDFVGAPIFARPDGVRARQGAFVVGGEEDAVERAAKVLRTTCDVWKFGADHGAGNVVKLCGNFLIAATIESLSEALALAEANGGDRVAVMNMLNSTIFDCLIYKGYGQRVSERDHVPGGFALELGLKDVTLVNDTAHRSNTPMPFASVLHDRFLAAKAQGLEEFDWSAIGLLASSDSGVDVSEARAAIQAAIDGGQKD